MVRKVINEDDYQERDGTLVEVYGDGKPNYSLMDLLLYNTERTVETKV